VGTVAQLSVKIEHGRKDCGDALAVAMQIANGHALHVDTKANSVTGMVLGMQCALRWKFEAGFKHSWYECADSRSTLRIAPYNWTHHPPGSHRCEGGVCRFA
jgi:hypothetical protein